MTSDFHKIENLKFDITKLQNALKIVLQRKSYDDAAGTKYIAGISLNQIPGDPESIKGSKVRGVYWTKPDSTGKEVSRDVTIEEEKYDVLKAFFEQTIEQDDFEKLKDGYVVLDSKTNKF